VYSGEQVSGRKLGAYLARTRPHNNHSSKYIPWYKTKVNEYIRMICVYGKSTRETRCMVLSRWAVASWELASQNSVGGSKHNNHNHDSISEHEAKVDKHIRTISVCRKSTRATRCIVVSGWAPVSRKPSQPESPRPKRMQEPMLDTKLRESA
jgi:hypothetical protein